MGRGIVGSLKGYNPPWGLVFIPRGHPWGVVLVVGKGQSTVNLIFSAMGLVRS